ncbi:uncharacterized protein LOC109703585 [Ananas comosus]|uniref:Uncharacterized protein LOC109703585 n=1 Tax=Ananas comosus TaxID=4615 RepID=A0A6P5EDU0_ANACO|nr:uncharacterized protein LOC109703585 [Ananas comosus]XP_020079843.1 uncharacterized protein LOC109703585 [Ananas comosus]
MPAESSVKAPPKVVKLDRALKLAESWVSKMSPSAPDEPEEPRVEARHPRLGLGAKAPLNVKAAALTDPVERKLFQKVKAKRRKSSPDTSKTSHAEENEASNDETDEPESRTSAFVKKRAAPVSSSSLVKKSK